MKRRTQVAISVVLALGGVYLLGDAFDLTPGVLTTRTQSFASYENRHSTSPHVRSLIASPELPHFSEHVPIPDSANVRRALDSFLADERLAGSASVTIVDTLTGATLAEENPTIGRVPASNMKLVTAAAALHTLGPDTRFATKASLAEGRLYLVGGGDVMLGEAEGNPHAVLGRAGLGDLAAATAKELTAKGLTTVNLQVDSSLFEEPTYHPDVAEADTEYVMELRSLAVRESRDETGNFTADPDLSAANTFVQALSVYGISATLEGRGRAPHTAIELARVESASLREILDVMLTDSDNTVAEVLGHLTAIAQGKPATFEGAAAAVTDVLQKGGYPMEGSIISDNSGLAISNRLTTNLLASLLGNLASCQGCELKSMGAGLPVMGLNGTVSRRQNETLLAGRVHAKTGTLITANSLSGYLVTTSGRLLTFSILVDGITEGMTGSARPAMDDMLHALAGL